MKRSVFFLKIFLLFFTQSFGQKTITQKEFEKLVDYANCKYIQAFIEKKDISKDYFYDTYLKKIKPELVKANLSNFQSIPSYNKIESLLNNNIPALKLAKLINERKSKYSNFPDNQSLLESLMTTGWNDINLVQIASEIKKEVFSKYGIEQKNNAEVDLIKTKLNQTSSQVKGPISNIDSLQLKLDELLNDVKKLYILTGILLLLLLFFAVLILRRTTRERIINVVLDSQRIEKKFRDLINSQITSISSAVYESLKYDFGRIDQKEQIKKKENEDNCQANVIKEKNESNYKYLKGKQGKIFSRVDSDPNNSFFRLFDEKDGYAKFEFFGDEAKAIANRVFTNDICDVIGSKKTANHVITLKPGTIKRVEDHWEVVEKVQIELSK
jgi:hypothetical protein